VILVNKGWGELREVDNDGADSRLYSTIFFGGGGTFIPPNLPNFSTS
jgi:hypothetical protein